MKRGVAEDQMKEQAALYALGTLTEEEARRFEEHIASGCEDCERELQAYQSVVFELGYSAIEEEPPAEVRGKLLARLAEESQPSRSDENTGRGVEVPGGLDAEEPGSRGAEAPGDLGAGEPGCKGAEEQLPGPPAPALTGTQASLPHGSLVTLRLKDDGWREVLEGVFVRRLYLDEKSGVATSLVKMLPGARLPKHRHLGIEQLLVLEGDCHIHGQVLGPGDYHHAPAGSIHEVTYTLNGTMFLLIAPEKYECLEQQS